MKKHKKPEEELENHLHQQYAENDNSRTGVFTSFIIGIVALFGFYGYVFVNTNKREYWNFDMLEFLLMSFIAIGILFFLAILALNLGYSLRRDQIVVYNIRSKRYKKKNKMKEIFGKLYKPYGKSFWEFILGYYNLFYWLFFCSEIFIFITTKIKICYMKDAETSFSQYKCIIDIVITFYIILIFLTIIIRLCYFIKYIKACGKYHCCRKRRK